MKISRARLKAFIMRRRVNTMTLVVLTAFSALVTFACALAGFARTDVLLGVTLGLIALCAVQAYKLRSSFRTMRIRGVRKKRERERSA